MLMCIGFLLPAVAAEQSYTIAFSNSSSDASNVISAANLLKQVEEGADYIASFSDIANAYAGVYGIKMSSSKNAGSFTMNLSDAGKVEATKIVVNAKRYGTDQAALSLSVNGGTAITQSVADEADYTFDYTGDVSSLKFSSTKRSYIKSITVYYEGEGEIDPPTPPVTELSEPVPPIITPGGGKFVNSVIVTVDFAEENSDLAGSEKYGIRYNLSGGYVPMTDVDYEGPIELPAGVYSFSAHVYNKETGAGGPWAGADFQIVTGPVDVLTVERFTSNTSSSYGTYTYTSEQSGITYEAQMAPNGFLQLRATNPSGIVAIDNPYHYIANKVELEWNSKTVDARTVDIYGKNSNYSGPGDLYASESRGEKLGSLNFGSTELYPDQDCVFLGLRSASGALYLDRVTITYAPNEMGVTPLYAPEIEVEGTMHTFHLLRQSDMNEEPGDAAMYYAICEGLQPLDGFVPEKEEFILYPDTQYPEEIPFPAMSGDYTVFAYTKALNQLRYEDSPIVSVQHSVHVVRPVEVYPPVISPMGGEYSEPIDVTLSYNNPEMEMEPYNFEIWYTTDGSDPMDNHTTAQVYIPYGSSMGEGIYLSEGTWTINARVHYYNGFDEHGSVEGWSDMASETFIITRYHIAQLEAPIISPDGGTFNENDNQMISISFGYGNENLDPEWYQLYYSVDSEPEILYEGEFMLTPGEHVVRAWVYDMREGWNGPEAEATFVIKEGAQLIEEVVTFDFTDTNATVLYGFPQAPASGKDCFLNDGTYQHPSGMVMSVATKTGNGVKWWNSNGNYNMRIYKGNSVTFSAPGKRIVSMSINASQNDLIVQDAEGNPWHPGIESVVLSEPSDGKNTFISNITFVVESYQENPDVYEVADFADAANFMETAKSTGMVEEDAEGNVVTTVPVVIPGKLHVIYVNGGVAHLQDEAQNNIRLEGVPEGANLSTDNAIAEVHAYLMENKSTGVCHLVYASHENHEDVSEPVAAEVSLVELVAAMEENPVSHMHNYVYFSNISYDHTEQTIYVEDTALPAGDDILCRAAAQNATATLGVRNDLGIHMFDVDADKEVNISGVIDKEGDSYVLVPTKFEVVTGVKAIYADGISVIDRCINAPEGSRIFTVNGMEVSGKNVAAGIYFVVTPAGATVKCLVK